MSQVKTSKLPVIIAISLCTGALAAGAFVINHTPSADHSGTAGSVYILGPARGLLAQSLYTRADLYFHKGTPALKKVAFYGFFQKWKEKITPTDHLHTEGKEVQEILPWLRLATKSDPHNIEIYLVAAYWLNGDCQRTDLAILAIAEAIENNPKRYELLIEMAQLHISEDDYAGAIAWFEKALAVMLSHEQDDQDQALIDLGTILTTRSFLYEALDDKENALQSTRDFLVLRKTEAFEDRLAKLENDGLDSEAAKAKLKLLFKKEHVCDRDDHEDHVHDEHCNHEQHVHGPDCNHEVAEEEHVHGPDCNHEVVEEEHVHGPDCNH